MRRPSLGVLMLFLSVAMLSSCGGESNSQPYRPATAVIKIETTGALDQGTMIGGITVTGVLPEGVSVKASPDAQNPSVLVTDSGVVAASGVTGANASAFATYDPIDRKVAIHVTDQEGFATGEFVTVTCDIGAGPTPEADSFGLEGFTPKDLNGATIVVLDTGFTVDIF